MDSKSCDEDVVSLLRDIRQCDVRLWQSVGSQGETGPMQIRDSGSARGIHTQYIGKYIDIRIQTKSLSLCFLRFYNLEVKQSYLSLLLCLFQPEDSLLRRFFSFWSWSSRPSRLSGACCRSPWWRLHCRSSLPQTRNPCPRALQHGQRRSENRTVRLDTGLLVSTSWLLTFYDAVPSQGELLLRQTGSEPELYISSSLCRIHIFSP